MKYSIKDYLIASPFSRDTDFKGELTKDIFYKKYFIGADDGTYSKLNEQIITIFNEASPQLPLSIFLYGYSGIGKTTYIRWFAQQFLQSYNVVFFDFADVIGSKHEYLKDNNNKEIKSIKVFDQYYRDKILKIYDSHSNTLSNILFSLHGIQLRISNTFSESFLNYLDIAINGIDGIDDISLSNIKNLTKNSSYQDLLLLILLLFFYCPDDLEEISDVKISKNKPLIFIFDNIDHIEIEHNNADFPRRIEATYHNLKLLLRELDKKGNPIYFLFCLRDANCSIINRQLADIRSRHDVEFAPSLKEDIILSRRISVAEQEYVNFNKEKIEFLKYVFTDKFTKKAFLPLFNFNLRKLSEFFVGITIENEQEHLYFKQIKDLTVDETVISGSRGIEYFLLIKYLLSKDYLKNKIFLEEGRLIGGVEGGYVNEARIILTNLHNLNKFAMNAISGETTVIPVDLFKLYHSFNEIFTENKNEDVFFDILSKLFLFHEGNWCHLVSFSGKHVYSNEVFKEEIEALKDKNYAFINTVKVQITPAGFIYIRDIIRHYEFFSIRAGNKKPLFCINTFKLKGGRIILNSLKSIEETFKLTKECIESLNKFLKSGIVDDFESSIHCFRVYSLEDDFKEDYYENNQGRLYIIRILDTHINYLDTYRHYLLNFNTETKNLKIVFRKQINEDLILVLEKYILLLRKTITKRKRVMEIVDLFNSNIKKIRDKQFFDFSTCLNDGRKNMITQ